MHLSTELASAVAHSKIDPSAVRQLIAGQNSEWWSHYTANRVEWNEEPVWGNKNEFQYSRIGSTHYRISDAC